MDLLTIDAAIFDEKAGSALLQFGIIVTTLAAVCTDIFRFRRARRDHDEIFMTTGSVWQIGYLLDINLTNSLK